MDDPYISDLEYSVLNSIQKLLENPSTMTSFLEVLPPDCSSEDVLISLQISIGQYNNTPAKELLRILGNKGKRVSHLIRWFQESGLERALMFLKEDVSLRIIEQPKQEIKVYEGNEIILKCKAVSYPPPEYQWYKDDVELLLEVEPILTIKSAKLEDSGMYACLVTKPLKDMDLHEWMYSNVSEVEVIESDLHAIPPCDFLIPSSSFVNNRQDLEPLNKGMVKINKHPFIDGKVAQGMSVCLICEAICSIPVNYQWFKNGKPMQGQTASQLVLNHLYPDPDTGENKWNYQCEVFNEVDRAISEIAVVELDETNDRTPFTATQKYAFMVGNDDYEHFEVLEKPAADIRDMAHLLSSIGFKVLAFRNLTLTEMRNAFISYCKMLTPGSYSLFFFAGHGFELYGQTYLQPVDCSDRLSPDESVCSEYILEGLQERKPALNVLLIDACRKLPHSQGRYEHQPGKIFTAHMKNNTIYGYSTSFLCASHESDQETNSVFVKHLKKHITHDRCIEDILIAVKSDFSKDPVAKNIQFPTIKSTLTEKRKLNDPILDGCISTEFSDIINWCDVKRTVISQPFGIPQIKAAIIIEFHHHMETFCNGIDVLVFFQVEPNAQIFILHDMEINIAVTTLGLNMVPANGKALKDINFLVGNRNLLFKKEILNIQKVNVEEIKGKIFLKFISRNVTKEIDFSANLVKISPLQLSVNHLTSSNIEETSSNKNQTLVKNLFK